MKRLLLLASLALSCLPLKASVTIDLSAGQLLTQAGTPLPDGSLIQLLASTSGSTFAAPTDSSFTGGISNDVVLASFGLDSTTSGTSGDFERVITLTLSAGLSAGDSLLLRWYPTLTAASTAPGSGTSYGQFRTDSVVDGSDIAWVLPGDGSTDSLVFSTASQGGSQPDSAGEASQSTPVATPAPAPPKVTSPATAEVVLGEPFSYYISATEEPTSFQASGLPAGLNINEANGLISGVAAQAGVFSVNLSAANAAGAGTATLALTVETPPAEFPSITSATAADAVSGQAFSYQIRATNNPTAFGASGLPGGLSINAASGLISGLPVTAGVFNVGLSASNSEGTGSGFLTLTVEQAPASPTPAPTPDPTPTPTPVPTPTPAPVAEAPVITSVLAVNGEVGVAFDYQITASNEPEDFGAGPLPGGLTIDAATGLVSGKPTEAGAYSIPLAATNNGGTGTASLLLTVAPAPLPVVTVVATIPKVTVGRDPAGEFTLKLSKVLSKALAVDYVLKGSAINGTDYHLLTGIKKIPAGSKKAVIKVVPRGDLDGAAQKAVILILLSGKDYTLGTTAHVKVKIVAGK